MGRSIPIIVFILLIGMMLVLFGYRILIDHQEVRCSKLLIDDECDITYGAHNILCYDLDGDGHLELIADAYKADSIVFYKYSGNPRESSNWTRWVIDDDISEGANYSVAHYTAIADINGDGRYDLVLAEKAGLSGVFNIGTGVSMTINSLALMMKEIVNKDADTVYAPPRKGEIRHSRADISLAESSFNYNPSTEMYDNLVEYIEWIRNEVND